MKTVKLLGALALAGVCAMSANADTITYKGTQVNQPYVGIKVGRISDTFEKTSSYEVTNYGVVGGYNFDQHFGAEIDYTISETKHGDKMQAYGGYGTYRYDFENTPFYAKAKAGYAKVAERVSNPVIGIDNTDPNNPVITTTQSVTRVSDAGFAYGIGAGYKVSDKIGVEASFSRPHKDVDVVSIGANLAF